MRPVYAGIIFSIIEAVKHKDKNIFHELNLHELDYRSDYALSVMHIRPAV